MSQLEGLLRPGDVLLTIGAGDVDRIAAMWLEAAS
jgi:UDP-N-acetylmuramate-alanine ligase